MTATKVDMSLDDIIKKNKIRPVRGGRGRGRGGRGARGGGRGARGGGAVQNGVRRGGGGMRGGRGFGGQRIRGGGAVLNGVRRGSGGMRGGRGFGGQRGNVNARWSHDMFQGGARALPGPAKLLIANLDFGVSDSDIHELFAEFGTMRNAAVHYDRSGRSLGTAHVVFERRADALKASRQYNGVHLDGRPMNITIDGQMQARSAPPVKRLSQGPRTGRGFGGRGAGRGAGRGGRGRGAARGGRGGNGRGGKTKVPTAEELDAELDAYVNQVNK